MFGFNACKDTEHAEKGFVRQSIDYQKNLGLLGPEAFQSLADVINMGVNKFRCHRLKCGFRDLSDLGSSEASGKRDAGGAHGHRR
jgi:hypothetical protein